MASNEASVPPEIASALADAKARGLPDGWKCSIDKRNRRKWTAPGSGRSCDSIPKALAMSVEMGLLPPDTVIERKNKKRKNTPTTKRSAKKVAKRKAPPATPQPTSLLSLGSSTRPADSILRRESSTKSVSYKEVDENDFDDELAPPPTPTPSPKKRPRKSQSSHTNALHITLNPATSLDLETIPASTRREACLPTAVHWDPDCPDGRKVGWRVSIPVVDDPDSWIRGRVHRYDPHTHKHQIKFDLGNPDEDAWIWLRNRKHNLRVATRIVWAQVKGYAWWPALVMESVDQQREGFVLLEFFGTGETATLRETDDCVRPFDPNSLDPVVAKHRKKRNQKAFQLASEEYHTILKVRNEAAIFYARVALAMASRYVPKIPNNSSKSPKVIPTVGQTVRIFRSDVNYPYGDTIVGTVRQYSPTLKKWLVSFEDSSKYPSTWLNLLAKEHSMKMLHRGVEDKDGKRAIIPHLFGYVPLTGSVDEYAPLLSSTCGACSQALPCSDVVGKSALAHELTVVCSHCDRTFHAGCADPPITPAMWQRMARDETDFVCRRCTTCRGCYRKDVAFGVHLHPSPPPNVKLPNTEDGLPLCVPCREHYDAERFCPNCAHVWDDSKYYLWRKEMKEAPADDTAILFDGYKDLVFGSFESDELPLDFPIDPKLFHPETSEWGYTEDDMLVCDGCNVWLHASCSGLTPEEYNATTNGQHPIYSVEFLCYMCCRERCKDIIKALRIEDKSMLFAIPVSEKDVPNYFDMIKEPMDLQTMERRAETEDSLNYVWVRENFELMVRNALTFNRYYTAIWQEAKRFYLAAMANVLKKKAKAAQTTKYTEGIRQCFKQAEEAIKNEKERVQVDDTIEKKDLVAGSEVVATFSLPNLRENGPDLSSCIPCIEIQLSKVDSLYCSWMDSCFTCGSSGASDTFLFCVDCGEAFHSFCVSAPIKSMDYSAVAAWRCPNCKICEISGGVPDDETRMIYCDMCDRAFSLDLLDPPLETVPEGLWICGLCVDCKICGNTAEKDGPSLKYWSQDPSKCFRCGGGTCLMDECLPKCQVCTKFLRGDDTDFLGCTMCGALVHFSCDPTQRALESEGSSLKDKYLCPACNRPSKDTQSKRQDRSLLLTLAMNFVEENRNKCPDEVTREDLLLQVLDQVDWSLRNQYIEQFLAIASDGIELYRRAKSIGDPRFVIQQVLRRMNHLPPFLGHRALRFATLVKQKGWDAKGFATGRPDTAIAVAKLAAAFINVVSKTLGTSKEGTSTHLEQMESLLIGPNDSGEVVYPTKCLDLKFDNSQIGKRKDSAVSEVLSVSAKQRTNDQADRDCYKIAKPLCGWDKRGSASMGVGVWKDPRECCLCHICGDADAGLLAQSPEDWETALPHQGRLLPLSGGFWVHSSCALWSSEVYETAVDNRIHCVEKARSRGAQLKCFGCGHHGATVGCNKGNCPFNYHYPCAKICGAAFTTNQRVYCPAHRESMNAELAGECMEQMKALLIAPEPAKPKLPSDRDFLEAEDSGLCRRVGSLIVHAFGAVESTTDGFHSQDYITPPGFVSSRIFWSTEEPRRRTMYVMKVEKSCEGKPQFSISPSEDPAAKICAPSANEAYSMLLEKIKRVNADHFSEGKSFSKLPMVRRTRRKTFGLNGPQFFGFGLDPIRRRIEASPGVEAVVAPLTGSSPMYRFCFVYGPGGTKDSLEELVRDLQRRRVAAKAEEALQNISGCARTEGIKAVVKSGGSGRITRALVRFAEDDDTSTSTSVAPSCKKADEPAKAERNIVQVQYRAMKETPMSHRLVTQRSHIHGWGLFTKVDIAKHSPVVEYMGEVITQKVADKRERSYELSGEGSCYMFRLDLTRVVDATKIGCMARFMNHSCDPNAYAKCIAVDTEQGQDKKIVVFALRDIYAGEEITYDYKFPVEDGSIRCGCGAPNCIGRLN